MSQLPVFSSVVSARVAVFPWLSRSLRFKLHGEGFGDFGFRIEGLGI